MRQVPWVQKNVQVNQQILRIKAGALREFFNEKSPTTGATPFKPSISNDGAR